MRSAGFDRRHGRQLPAGGAGRIGDAGQRILRRRRIRQMRDGAAPAVPAVIGDQPFAERLVRHVLIRSRIARAHGQPAFVDHLLAKPGDELAPHLFEEITGRLALGIAEMHGERLGHRRLRLLGRDRASLRHAGQHPVAPRLGRLRMARGIVVIGRFRQGGDERGLGQGQLVEGLLEIRIRGGGNAIRAGAEINLVEVDLENAVLAELMLDPIGEQRLFDLARDGHLVTEQKVTDDLLRDRRRADRPLTALKTRQIGHRSAEDRSRVDAVMGIKIAIFGGQHRLDHRLRHLADRHNHPVLAGKLGHKGALARIHLGTDCGDIFRELLMVRQFAAEIDQRNPDKAADADRSDDNENEESAGNPAQNPVHCRGARRRPGMTRPRGIAGVRLGVGWAISLSPG